MLSDTAMGRNMIVEEDKDEKGEGKECIENLHLMKAAAIPNFEMRR